MKLLDIVFLWLGTFFLGPGSVVMALTIDIHKGIVASVPLAFPGFHGGDNISEVVSNDLGLSGVFQILLDKGPQSPQEAFSRPELWYWQFHKGAVLCSGTVTESDGVLSVLFRLYDVGTQVLLGEAFVKGEKAAWRSIAHKVSNAIYKRLTGEEGYFDTKIVYTAQYGPPTQKVQRIAIIDQDGANGCFLTSSAHKAFTPRSAYHKPMIAFTAFRGLRTLIYLYDLVTHQSEAIPVQGVCMSPRFAPNRSDLLFCIAKQGTTSIYRYPLDTGQIERITQTSDSIDVSPSYGPDGKTFVFSSDRGGRQPKLYLMAPGTPAVLLSRGEGSYLAPVWSPDGKWITFVRKKGGSYYLGIMAPNGSQERMLATDHVIDHPSWAPNSRALVFAAQQRHFGPFSLYLVDLTGRCLRKIPTACQGVVHEGNHPDWCKYPR